MGAAGLNAVDCEVVFLLVMHAARCSLHMAAIA